LKPELQAILNYAGAAAGVELHVTSAGQYPEKSRQYDQYLKDTEHFKEYDEAKKKGLWNGPPIIRPQKIREGSDRHDDGNAGDVTLSVRDSNGHARILQWTKDEDKAIMTTFVERAVEAGATGVGAGYKGMGKSAIHIGFGSEKTWGRNGDTNSPGPEWVDAGYAAGKARRNAFAVRGGLRPWLDAVNGTR
jgi:hypothetical protein